MEPKRLNKLISDSGFCSRREADKLIEQGRVTVNGKIPEAGMKVTDKDKVRIDDETLSIRHEEPVFLLFNKPVGIATTTDLAVKNNIIRAINYPASILPIGFLDREAEGLMFLSNNTELVRKMTKADTKFEKEYVVTLDKMISPEFLSKVSDTNTFGHNNPDKKKNFVVKEGPYKFRIVLEPHTNHYVKKLCEDHGYKVMHLQRTRIAHFTSAKLAVGLWRVLTEAEVHNLKSIVLGKTANNSTNRSKVTENFYDVDEQPSRSRAPKQRSSFNQAGKTNTLSRRGKAIGNFDNPKSAAKRSLGKKQTKISMSSYKNNAKGTTENKQEPKKSVKS